MSEDRTKKLNEPNSSEARFERMEIRITNLEERQYDTKPIWERALAEIADARSESRTNNEVLRTEILAEIAESRSECRANIEGLRNEMKADIQGLRTDTKADIEGLRNEMKAEIAESRSENRTNIEGMRNEMKAEFAAVRHEIEHGLRGVARTIDTLNHNVLEMQTYQRYLDRRLEELETQTKPT